MGGPGSGWQGPRRWTVAECLTVRLKMLREGPERGLLHWPGVGSVEYEWHKDGLMLRYGIGQRRITDFFELAYSVLHYGGLCPYLLCPGCAQRVRTLHMPPGQDRFRCRTCHGVTYGSCQASHRWDALGRRLGIPLDILAKA